MIHITRHLDTMQVKVSLRGDPAYSNVNFHIPMELIARNPRLNEVYTELRCMGDGPVDHLYMLITNRTYEAMRHLEYVFVLACQSERQPQCKTISEGSVLA